jgi:N6-L-threonylcarbamoyladenine synthase
MQKKYILAIETSCDDTSIAISCEEKILSNITLSSQEQHKQYGGIVPEIAARSHQTNLSVCYQKAIEQAQIKSSQLTHIAYTDAPGLPGSLHMGKIFAKSLSTLLNIPIVPINHMHGHIYSFGINDVGLVKYPFLSLIVSGGHTTIYLVKSSNEIISLNETVDDAIGETLDKVGRILDLSYPGGKSIDDIYEVNKSKLKMIHHFRPDENFSFSGIKTHILNLVNQTKMRKQKLDKIQIASSLLQWTIDELMIKLNYYIDKFPEIKFVSVGGGVSANQLLRKEIQKLSKQVILPKMKYTNDNAAMIAFCAYLTIK